jgi:hypothetical protein
MRTPRAIGDERRRTDHSPRPWSLTVQDDTAHRRAANPAVAQLHGLQAATVRGRWMRRSLILEVEGTLPGTMNLAAAQGPGPEVERAVFTAVNEVRRVIWIPRTVDTAPDSR